MGGDSMITIYGINEAIAIEEQALAFLKRLEPETRDKFETRLTAMRTTEWRIQALKHIMDNLNG
jgi:hypothetical protein